MEVKKRRNDGFTQGQRKWLLGRDGSCVLCGNNIKLECHHLVPFRFAMNVLRWTLERTNSPTNGVVLCLTCHRGDENSIHPDTARAGKMYHTDKQIYNKMFAKRDELCRSGLVYWNQSFDNILSEIATRNTLCYVAKGAPIDVWTNGKDYKVAKFLLTDEVEEEEIEHKETVVEKVILKPKGNVDIVTPNFQGSMLSYLAKNKG